MRNAYKDLIGNPEGKHHPVDAGIYRTIISTQVDLKETGTECSLATSSSRYELLAGSCKHGTESSVSITGGILFTILPTITVSGTALLYIISFILFVFRIESDNCFTTGQNLLGNIHL
jgi:hypothetical protein